MIHYKMHYKMVHYKMVRYKMVHYEIVSNIRWFKAGQKSIQTKMSRLYRKMTRNGHFFYIIYTFLFGCNTVFKVAQFWLWISAIVIERLWCIDIFFLFLNNKYIVGTH